MDSSISSSSSVADLPRPKSTHYDLPRWLSLVIVVGVSVSVPFSLVLHSSEYLTSESGFADGGDMYSHITEALHVKQQLQRGETDLWYAGVTLGYPVFLAYQPLPCLVTAAAMIVGERYIHPLRMFRWLFAALLTALPWSWYIGSRQIGLTRLQSSLVTLCMFSVRSWVDFGLELTAFHVYGLYTQAYGMLMLPLAVGFTYKYVLYGEGSGDIAVVSVTLNLLSHTLFGIYVMLFTVTMVTSMILVGLVLSRGTHGIIALCGRALEVHVKSIVLCAWWVVPTLCCYQYIGGLPWKYDVINPHSISIVTRQFLSGEVYDYGRGIPFVTLGTLVGIFCIFIGHHSVPPGEEIAPCRTHRRQVLYVWLGLSFYISFSLFLGRGTFGSLYNLIPFHGEIESLRYLSAIHFIGLLISAMGISFTLIHICKFIARISGYTFNQLVVMVMLLGVPLHLSNQSERLVNHLTVTEMSGDLRNRIQLLKEHPMIGRLYGNKYFETEGPWELSFLPYFSDKPGIQTYSRGYHDSLTVYYLECFQPNLTTIPWFPELLRLFNIRYIFAKTIQAELLQECQLLKLMKLNNETTVYIRTPEEAYGYFEFVHVPGSIQGDLKGMREAVVILTQIFQVRALLAINPDDNELHTATAKVKVKPVSRLASFDSSFSRLLRFVEPPDKYVTNWAFKGLNVSENDFLNSTMGMYVFRPIRSVVLKETVEAREYSALVEVPPEAFTKNIYSTEHLLLKVTYHPYWSCRYAPPIPIANHYNTGPKEEYTDQEYNKWEELEVYHVTPNLMSVVLPPGRHEVICSYSNPWYQKLGFILFLFIISMVLVKEILRKYREIITRMSPNYTQNEDVQH